MENGCFGSLDKCNYEQSVDPYRFDADPDLTFHFDAEPDPDPFLNFTHVKKSDFFNLFIRSSTSLPGLIFLVSVIFVIIFGQCVCSYSLFFC
jgi:hypothetical protein